MRFLCDKYTEYSRNILENVKNIDYDIDFDEDCNQIYFEFIYDMSRNSEKDYDKLNNKFMKQCDISTNIYIQYEWYFKNIFNTNLYEYNLISEFKIKKSRKSK